LLATTPLERRPSSIAARCRRPPRPGHPGPPLAELRLGIGPRRHPPSFPPRPGHPRGPGPPAERRRRPGRPPLFSSVEGGGRRGQICPKPPPFPLIWL